MAWAPPLEVYDSPFICSVSFFSIILWQYIYRKHFVDIRRLMKRSTLVIFATYILTKTLLGLVIHPYKSVRQVTRHKILVPIVFSPLYALVVLFIVGRIGSFLFEVHDPIKRMLIAQILGSGLISILLWQFLLLYLLTSFLLAFRRS